MSKYYFKIFNLGIFDYPRKKVKWGTILQRYKTGNEKVTDILSDQTIPRFVVSHFYSIFNPKIFGS
jgi:hypothetical protein